MANKLSRVRSTTETVFKSYIEGKNGWDQVFEKLIFIGPGTGKSVPIFNDDGTPTEPLKKDFSVKLIDNKSKTFNINRFTNQIAKVGGFPTICCHIEQKVGSLSVMGWCPIQWIKYESIKVGYNMGNAAEGILAAAIAARFVNKSRPISNEDVINILNKIPISENQNSTIKTFESENYRTNIKDDVILSIQLSPINMKLLFPEKLLNSQELIKEKNKAISDRLKLITPCRYYANSREITQLARLVYFNRLKDVIQITADGITREKETKVDVSLSINGRDSVIIPGRYSSNFLYITQISLKREVDQFAQVGGWKKNFLKNFWGKILNDSNFANNDSVRNVYDNIQAKETTQQAAEVMRGVYEIAKNQFNAKFNGINKTEIRNNFINVLNEFATKNEQNVQMVEIVGGGYIRFDFKDKRFKELLENPNVTLNAIYSTSNPKSSISGRELPIVTISADVPGKGSYDLVKFRAKIEWDKKTVRNYVEKQKGLIDFVGSQ